jgi:FdhD protein
MILSRPLVPDRQPLQTDNPPDGSIAPCHVHAFADRIPEQDQMDHVAVETPLELRVGGKPITVLMRTPGHDEDLVRGFLFTEDIIRHPTDIVAIGRPPNLNDSERGNVLEVQLAAPRQNAAQGARNDRGFYSNSSCGVCGKKTIAALTVHGRICESGLRISRHVLAELPERLKAAQCTFALTGGVHASGLFTADGELVAVREDVGRHNALDKLIGWALADGKIPLSEHVLLVSGRVSYELVQKAVAASLPLIAAVGAPSSLAVEIAQRFKITLIGFLRSAGMNVYTSPVRVVE